VTSGEEYHNSHIPARGENTWKLLAFSSTARSHGSLGIYTNSSQLADNLTWLEEAGNLSHLARTMNVCLRPSVMCYILPSLPLSAKLLLSLLPVQGARCGHTHAWPYMKPAQV